MVSWLLHEQVCTQLDVGAWGGQFSNLVRTPPSPLGSVPGASIPLTGGRQGKLPVTAFEAFDLETRTWTRHPSLPSRRAFAGCAMAEGSVFSLGGLQQPGPHNFYSRPHFVNTVEMFDLEHGEQCLFYCLHGTEGSACVRACVCTLASAYVCVHTPYIFSFSGSWTKLPRSLRMRDKRADFVVGSLGGNIVAIGGLGECPWKECLRAGPPSLGNSGRALGDPCLSINQGTCDSPDLALAVSAVPDWGT